MPNLPDPKLQPPASRLQPREARAFTVVELLVVISIIALLMSLLMPSMKQARDLSMRIKCSSNVRAQMLAAVTYSTDYKGGLPNYTTATQFCEDYAQMLNGGYLNGVQVNGVWQSKILRCPSGLFITDNGQQTLVSALARFRNGFTGNAIIQFGADSRRAGFTTSPGIVITDYCTNGEHYVWDSGHPFASLFENPNNVRLDMCTKPSNTWATTDGSEADFGMGHTAFRHIGMTTSFSYLDGHSEVLGPIDVDANNGIGWPGSRVVDTRLYWNQ